VNILIRVQQNAWAVRLRWGLAVILWSSVAFSEPQIAGRYVLQTAGGKTLPAVVAENNATGYRQEVTGGWMALEADRTFTWRTAYRTTQQGGVTTSESAGKGRYSVTGDVLLLTPEGSSASLNGVLTNRTLTIQADVKLVYRRDGGT
jgi:predicted small secreted protein